MQNKLFNTIVVLIFMVSVQNGWALPIDWNGVFSVDTTRMDAALLNIDTGEFGGGGQLGAGIATPQTTSSRGATRASFQTYIFKLQPTIIVNDAVSLFGEITTGYASGGHFGQGVEQTGNNVGGAGNRGFGNALYHYNTYRDALHIRQAYAKYYSDIATYVIGRQPVHWGLGAILNDGRHTQGGRFASIEDGMTAHFDIGNFRLSPYFMKVNGPSLDDSGDIKSVGVQAMYRSSERDLSFGILLGKRENNANNTFFNSILEKDPTTPPSGGSPNPDPANDSNYEMVPLGSVEVKIVDIYFQKGFKKINFELEVPIMDGSLGRVYGRGENNGYNARAFIGKASYELDSAWKLGVDMGYISGDQGRQNGKFEALYLHPSYQIAHLMFRYNIHAIDGNNEESIFDSYMTNARFTKLMATYRANKWLWNIGLVWASAGETAKSGSGAFYHERNIAYTARGDQSDDYGFEIDLDFKYEWNSNVSILGSLGYHFVGDYYKYDGRPDTSDPDLDNAYAARLQTIVSF